MASRQKILAYVKQKYGTVPDFPWLKYPDYGVLRHQKSRKWYGVLMKISPTRLGLQGEAEIQVINLKCDPLLSAMFQHENIFPAYHMNKKYWISVVLEGSLPDEEIHKLIDLSYQLTA